MIRLQSLSMDNFRGIGHGEIDGLADVNVLVGRNNSGKTTVIEAIQRLAAAAGFQRDIIGRDLKCIWETARSSAVTDDLMSYRRNAGKPFSISGTVGNATVPASSMTFTYHAPNPQQIEKRGVRHIEFTDDDDNADQDETSRLAIESRERRTAFFSAVTVLRPQDAFNVQIEQDFWPALLSDRRDKTLTATLNDVFGLQAESLQLLPNNQLMVLFNEYSLPLDAHGDGMRAAVRTLMVLAMMHRTLLMLEEPESHQHPGSLERFSTAVCRLARSQEVQIIVSTHSEECVRAFLKGAQAAGSDAAVFHLALNDGKQQARRLDPQAVETLMSTGVDVRLLDLYA